MKKLMFLNLTIFLLLLSFILPNLSLAANVVTRKGIIIQKDVESLVIEANESLSFWQAVKRLFKYGKVKYVVFNKSLTEIQKTTGSALNRKIEKASFNDLKIGDSITVKGELLKKASREENGEINANLIILFTVIPKTSSKTIIINGTTITSSSVISLNTNDINKEKIEEPVVNSVPWLKSSPVVTQPGVTYKSMECADDGEPILQKGLGTPSEVPTKCCTGLNLCYLSKNNTNNILNYKGFAVVVIGYCKTTCPDQDNSEDLLPTTPRVESWWNRLLDIFRVKQDPDACSTDADCRLKYCGGQFGNCTYYCSTEKKCVDYSVLQKITCQDNNECALINGKCAIATKIGIDDNSGCVCSNGQCIPETSTSTTTKPGSIILTCDKDVDCGWCNFNCLTQSEKDNLKNMGIVCDKNAKPGFKCSCFDKKCKAIPDLTPTTKVPAPIIINPNPGEPIDGDSLVPPSISIPSIITPPTTKALPVVVPTTLPSTTTTIGGCQGYYINSNGSGEWCDKCSTTKCGDGICNCREKYPEEKYFGQPGALQITLYSQQNYWYCPFDCQQYNPQTVPPVTYLTPPSSTTTSSTTTTTTKPSVVVPGDEVCTVDWIPVCGMDGVIYSNDCFAKNVGLSFCRNFTEIGYMTCQCN